MSVVKLTKQLITDEFELKEILLSRSGEWTSPTDFYFAVLHTDSLEKETMMVEAGNTFKVLRLGEILDTAIQNEKTNWYISMADYFQHALKQSLLDELHAFVMDLDMIRPKSAEIIINSSMENKFPKPTFVVNSGSGLHFYYVLEEGLQMYMQQRKQAKSLLKAMHRQYGLVFPKIGLAQNHWIGQPYRVVGSRTKEGNIVTAYRTGEEWKIEDLAKVFGIKWQPPKAKEARVEPTEKMVDTAKRIAASTGEKLPDLNNFSKTYQFIGKHIKKPSKAGEQIRMYFGNENKGAPSPTLYYRTVNNIQQRSGEGFRYTSLMALAVIAIKCQIPFEQLEMDVNRQAAIWSEDLIHYVTPFNLNNVPDALRMYDSKFIKVTSKQLEEWLGWEFDGIKRNGRTREENLKFARAIRDVKCEIEGRDWRENNGPKNKQDIVVKYFEQNPGATVTKASRDLGLSRPTIYKWKDS